MSNEASFSDLLNKVSMSFSVSDLSRSDQVRLLRSLMRESGLDLALFGADEMGKKNSAIYIEIMDKYIAGNGS